MMLMKFSYIAFKPVLHTIVPNPFATDNDITYNKPLMLAIGMDYFIVGYVKSSDLSNFSAEQKNVLFSYKPNSEQISNLPFDGCENEETRPVKYVRTFETDELYRASHVMTIGNTFYFVNYKQDGSIEIVEYNAETNVFSRKSLNIDGNTYLYYRLFKLHDKRVILAFSKDPFSNVEYFVELFTPPLDVSIVDFSIPQDVRSKLPIMTYFTTYTQTVFFYLDYVFGSPAQLKIYYSVYDGNKFTDLSLSTHTSLNDVSSTQVYHYDKFINTGVEVVGTSNGYIVRCKSFLTTDRYRHILTDVYLQFDSTGLHVNDDSSNFDLVYPDTIITAQTEGYQYLFENYYTNTNKKIRYNLQVYNNKPRLIINKTQAMLFHALNNTILFSFGTKFYEYVRNLSKVRTSIRDYEVIMGWDNYKIWIYNESFNPADNYYSYPNGVFFIDGFGINTFTDLPYTGVRKWKNIFRFYNPRKYFDPYEYSESAFSGEQQAPTVWETTKLVYGYSNDTDILIPIVTSYNRHVPSVFSDSESGLVGVLDSGGTSKDAAADYNVIFIFKKTT